MAVRVLSGGVNLERKLAEIARGLKRGGTVRVGFLEGATYSDGTSVPMVAAINEFGAPSRGQPPRPFFRRMVADKSAEWPAVIGQLLVSTGFDVDKTLNITGLKIGEQLQQSIIDLVDPPLAESTVRAKEFDKPLIDTSTMLNSVGYEVDGTKYLVPAKVVTTRKGT